MNSYFTMNSWVTNLLKAKKSCITQNNLLKVHYALPDGNEMVEEYDVNTNVLNRRAWRIKNRMGGEGEWNVEVGDPEPNIASSDGILIKENPNQVRHCCYSRTVFEYKSLQPFIVKRITKRNIEWRIRNLPYPLQVYSVTADTQSCSLIVRTTNKKYFKKIELPELERVNLLPEQDRIKFSHQFNTLIITVSERHVKGK